MFLNKTFMITIYVIVGVYVIYKLLFRKDPMQQEYEQLYDKILNSEEHKVKGQYEK